MTQPQVVMSLWLPLWLPRRADRVHSSPAGHVVRDRTCGLEHLVYAPAMAKRMVVAGSAGPSGHGDDASHMQKAPSTYYSSLRQIEPRLDY
jgi:hypothetical protein